VPSRGEEKLESPELPWESLLVSLSPPDGTSWSWSISTQNCVSVESCNFLQSEYHSYKLYHNGAFPSRTEDFLGNYKMWWSSPKSAQILKIMGPHESLSEDLSNNYQCYRASIVSKIFIFLFYDFGDRSIQNYLAGVASCTPWNYGLPPRIYGWDIVSRTDTIELLYSYLAGMNGVAYTNAQCIV
jgi:hypothetical protein